MIGELKDNDPPAIILGTFDAGEVLDAASWFEYDPDARQEASIEQEGDSYFEEALALNQDLDHRA